ncbi:MAG: Fic family protein [Candidatus Korobacteraceae bacterium]
MLELIDKTLEGSTGFRLRPHVIEDLNRISIYRIEPEAGRWRQVEMRIQHSTHKPPSWQDVPRYIDEMCEYVNDNWEFKPAVHLAAYVMWRLNWIHPFIDGNGRTTRAVSYYVLCAKLAFRIPGVKTIPELIAANKNPYYDALEAADREYGQGRIDVSTMESLLKDLLAAQVVEALDRDKSVRRADVTRAAKSVPQFSTERRPDTSGSNTPAFSMKVGVVFGAVATAFLMALVLLQIGGHQLPESAKFIIVMIFALSGGFSAASLGGHASSRGSIPLPGARQHAFGYAVTGGIGTVVILLILGKYLFL